jgi:hypothetical protein
MAAVAQADRAYDRAVKVDSDCEARIEGRLRAALPSAHEVPERERLTGPIEHVHLGRRE